MPSKEACHSLVASGPGHGFTDEFIRCSRRLGRTGRAANRPLGACVPAVRDLSRKDAFPERLEYKVGSAGPAYSIMDHGFQFPDISGEGVGSEQIVEFRRNPGLWFVETGCGFLCKGFHQQWQIGKPLAQGRQPYPMGLQPEKQVQAETAGIAGRARSRLVAATMRASELRVRSEPRG
jgi:hypothetical protein